MRVITGITLISITALLALACCVLFEENSAQWYLLMLLILHSKAGEMGQDSGAITIVMGSSIPTFTGELLNFEGDQKCKSKI